MDPRNRQSETGIRLTELGRLANPLFRASRRVDTQTSVCSLRPVHRDRFDYDTFWTLLDRVRASHRLLRFADVRNGLPETPFVLLRHDIDYSPAAALEMAAQETARGVRASYFLLLNGPYYNVLDPRHAHVPARLVELGHEVGLHYDVNFLYGFAASRWQDLVRLQATLLESLSGQPIVSIAMHQPGLHGADPLRHSTDYLNAYDDRFFRDMCYISDSARAWRDDAWNLLVKGPLPPRVQLALHPINWGRADRSRHAIFTGIHAALADDLQSLGAVLIDQIDRHAGVVEHEASLERDRRVEQQKL